MAVRVGASYKKHYNADWEREAEFKVWLTRTEDKLVMKGHGEAFCKLCSTSIRAHRTDLLRHRKTTKHAQKESAVVDRRGRMQPTIVQVVDTATAGKTKLKENDLKLACYIAAHTSIKSIDHLCELLREMGEGSKLADLRLHRTKCSKLILKILGPSMLQELLDDLGQGYYSVIVDESTDVSVKNYMAVIIRYYSFKKKEMVLDFVGLIELNRATAEALYQAFTNFMKSRGFDLRRCIGLGTDGAPALCGCNHSLYTLLKENECPYISLVRCICHSLDKCASYASKELPPQLEYMLRETTNWFAHSSQRKIKYAEVHKKLNDGKAPPMLVKLAATRWLSWGNAVARVLDQFEVLKELFKAEAPSCHSAQSLVQLYHPTHQLYLTFLKPVLLDINSHNKLFQSSIADVCKVYKDLRLFVFRIARMILLRGAVPDVANAEDAVLRSAELSALKTALRDPAAYREIGCIDFGESFRKLAEKFALPPPVLDSVKQRCAKFLARLAQELVERIPLCIEATEKLRFFSPKRTLARVARPTFRQLPLDLVPAGFDMEVLERQWAAVGELTLTDVCPEEVAENKEVDTIKFWGNVWDLRNGAGEQPYKELAEYVLALLSLPLSNAVVERLFSILAVVKTKQRNCLSVPMLEAILRVREHLRATRQCCKTFRPTAAMVANFNSAVMYAQEKRRRAAQEEAEADAVGEQALDDPDVVAAGEVNEEELIYTLELMGEIDVREEIVYSTSSLSFSI